MILIIFYFQAVEIAQTLLNGGLIHHVSKDLTFKDDDGIYKFSVAVRYNDNK